MYGISVLFRYQVVSICSVRSKSNSTKKLLEFLAEMPKQNSARIAEAQRQRQHISKKGEKYAPSTVYLQVLGSGAQGVPNTLYLFTDQKRYLFNCGECTQRLAHEHKVKLSRLNHIFITSKTWKNIGGLPGLSLTLQDVGVPNITLHGPEGLDELYNATRRFVIMKEMNVTMAKCSPNEDFEDNVMSVKYVLLGPHDNILEPKDLKPAAKKPKLENNQDKEFEEFIHDETDYYKPQVRGENGKFNKHTKEKPKPKNNFEKVDPTKKKTEKVLHDLQKKTHCSVAYICTLKKRFGTLDLTKCVELGVKPGPMLGQLKSGQDVVLPDGTLVLSKDVKTPDDPGPVFIVLDVPDISYLKESEFSAHFDNGENPPENIPNVIVHYTPPEVFNHPTYRSFMALFGRSTNHLVLNSQNYCLGSEAVHRTQHKLHLLDPDIFPLLRDASIPTVWNSPSPVQSCNSPDRQKGLEELKNKIALAQFQNIINMEGSCKGDGAQSPAAELEEDNKLELITGRTLTVFHLRPRKHLDRSAEPKLHVQDYIKEAMDMDGFVSSLEQFRRQVDGLRFAKTENKEYPKVVFLGTGSCIPSKTRNTSAIAVQIDENRSMLLDCGEGTFGQLVRFFGPKKVSAFLRTLKAIYVSHLHADHHIGLIGVLLARRQAMLELNPDQPPDPLYLLAPGQIYTWLSVYDQQFERIRSDFTLIPNQNLLQNTADPNTEMTSAVLASIGVEQIRTCLVSHCPNAFGVAIDLDQQHKLTYSGDTIPCEELVKLGKNSTILIHEATMEDELADEARTKMHSTTSQAIDVGKQTGARYTVLTHFSQRYARLPRLNAHILNDNNTVGIAFDNMQVTMSDLELLPHMYAPLQLMFAEHCVEMELKAAHRARQKERAASPNTSSEKGAPHTRSQSRSRRGSRGSLDTSSVPRASYVESYSSRLRQEIKGMAVTGVVRHYGFRSKSSSPNKMISLTVPKPNNANAVSKNGEKSSEKSLTINSRSRTVSAKHYKQVDSKAKCLDVIATPRSMSETSNANRQETQRIRSLMENAPPGHVINTRSKILTTSSIRQTATPSENSLRNKDKSRNNSPGAGYGKPLVTSFNKKLSVIKDVTKITCPRFGVVTSVLFHLIFWRLAHIASCLCSLQCLVLITIIAVGVLFWTAGNRPTENLTRTSDTNPRIKSADKTEVGTHSVHGKQVRGSSTSLKFNSNKSPVRSENKQDAFCNKLKSVKLISQKDFKSLNPEICQAPCRQVNNGRPYSPPSNKSPPFESKVKHKNLAGFKPSPCSRPVCGQRITSLNRKDKPIPGPIQDLLCDRLKRPICKNPPTHIVGRLSSGIHSKSFKPQLEDIQSSFMLLNKKPQDHAKDRGSISEYKPKPLNEEIRKQQLVEIKQKFKSKHFYNDSRYDKIEGLNWISWK